MEDSDVAELEVLSRYLLGGTEQSHKTLVTVASFMLERSETGIPPYRTYHDVRLLLSAKQIAQLVVCI